MKNDNTEYFFFHNFKMTTTHMESEIFGANKIKNQFKN